jgi:hypothetical protein
MRRIVCGLDLLQTEHEIAVDRAIKSSHAAHALTRGAGAIGATSPTSRKVTGSMDLGSNSRDNNDDTASQLHPIPYRPMSMNAANNTNNQHNHGNNSSFVRRTRTTSQESMTSVGSHKSRSGTPKSPGNQRPSSLSFSGTSTAVSPGGSRGPPSRSPYSSPQRLSRKHPSSNNSNSSV